MPAPKNLTDFISSSEKRAPNIEAICPDGHPLEDAVTKLLQQGLQGIGADSDSVILNSYDRKSYGAEIELGLTEIADCTVSMNAILLEEGKIGNPVLVIDSPKYLEEILDDSTDDLIKIVGKKVFFSLSSDAKLQRTTTLGSSTAYKPYPQVISDSWGEPTVPAVSAKGFLVHKEASTEEEALFYEYLNNPADVQSLALAVKCSEEDRKIRDQKREQVLECIASDIKYKKRMKDLSKPSGVRPFPPDRC